MLDTTNTSYPLLHTKHIRSIPIFQDFIHEPVAYYEAMEVEEQQEGLVPCVLKINQLQRELSSPNRSTQMINSYQEVNQWLQMVVQLRTTGQVDMKTILSHSLSDSRAQASTEPDNFSSHLNDSIALL